jgi:hypothetical protein
MKIVRVVFVLLLSVVGARHSLAQHINNLKNLKQVHIVIEDLGDADEKIGLTVEALKTQTLVAIKRDMPKVVYTISSRSYVYVQVTTLFSNNLYHICLNVQVVRPVIVLTDENVPIGQDTTTVWETTTVLNGPGEGLATRVLADVSRDITMLAAAYFEANP